MNTKKASIPNPCSYGWDKMSVTNDNTGRHCKACDKIVVDFTMMPTEELHDFLMNFQNTKTCGHFRTIDTTIETTWFQNRLLNFHNHIELNLNKTALKSLALFAIAAILTLTGCSTVSEGELAADINDTRDSVTINSNMEFNKSLEKDNVSSNNTKRD